MLGERPNTGWIPFTFFNFTQNAREKTFFCRFTDGTCAYEPGEVSTNWLAPIILSYLELPLKLDIWKYLGPEVVDYHEQNALIAKSSW